MLIFRLTGRLFLAAGLIMILFAGYRAYDQWAFGSTAARAEGVVIDLVRDRRPGLAYRVVFGTVVRFQDDAGAWRQFSEAVSSNPPPYQRDERVPVLYDPAAPDQAVIDSFRGRFLVPVIFAFVGTVFLVLGTAILSSKMPERVSVRLRELRQAGPKGEA